MRAPNKRPAFEPPTSLARPIPANPAMRRPPATTVGAALVVLRVLAGVAWLTSLALQWNGIVTEAFGEPDGAAPVPADDLDGFANGSLTVILVVGAVVLAVELVLAVFIYLGHNWPRIIVMVFATLSISGSYATWWAGDQEVTLQTTLLTLSLDILVMLALSSRAARAYARRNKR